MSAPHESFRPSYGADHNAWIGSEMAEKRICSVDGCGKPSRARGYCVAHYKRWSRHGDPMAGTAPNGAKLRWLEEHTCYAGDDCVRWPFPALPSGYCHIHFNGQSTLASRVMCILAHGQPPTRVHQAAHSCGNGRRGCLNPRHLRWATKMENESDKFVHGSTARGERQGSSVLTREQVREIRRLSGSLLQREIAARFGVHRQHIGRIISRMRWAWLDD